MSTVLKSRTQFPPCGWYYKHVQTNWQMPYPMAIVFTQAVDRIIQHRLANPAALKEFSTTPEEVANELDAFLCNYLENSPRWVKDGAPPKEPVPGKPGEIKAVPALRRLASVVGDYVNGAAIVIKWLGVGGAPVEPALANLRARVCRSCWKHEAGSALIGAAGEELLEAQRLLRSAAMELEGDPIHSCGVCHCHLPLKVWMPRERIDATRDPGHSFPAHCWVNGDPSMEAQKPIGIQKGGTVVVQRTAARGDVIACMPVLTRLKELGYVVHFATLKACSEILDGHPDIDRLIIVSSSAEAIGDINLDGAYERSGRRQTEALHKIMFQEAAKKALAVGIALGEAINVTPRLSFTGQQKSNAERRLRSFPKPWIGVIPRSNSFVNKTIPMATWVKLRALLPGTIFWTGTDPLSSNLVDLEIRDFRLLADAISVMDLVISVDTGPMWLAQAAGRPLVYVAQSGSACVRMTDQIDYVEVKRDIPCINCNKDRCPIDVDHPPCADVTAEQIADAAMEKLSAYRATQASVSAIIPVYNPTKTRLERCVRSVVGQVSQVVLAVDGDGEPPEWMVAMAESYGGKVSILRNPSKNRLGYGHTCNRGARFSNGTHLLMLNDDVFASEGCVAMMLSTMADRSNCAVVGCLLRYPDGTIQHGGTMRGCEGYGHLDHTATKATVLNATEMEFVTFACALLKRSAFFSVRGFDEGFDCYHEDSDLCLRLRKEGWSVWYDPRASGIHEESQTTGPKKKELYAASRPRFWGKWKGYFSRNSKLKTLGLFSPSDGTLQP